jgi:hypothetical protein
LHKPKNKGINASWSQNGVWTNQTHKTHNDPNLEKATTSSPITYIDQRWGYIKMAKKFKDKNLNFPKL